MKPFGRLIIGISTGMVLALGVGATALAHPGHGGSHMGALAHPKAMERLAQRLQLEDNQRQQIDAIVESYRPQLQTLRDAVREQRQALETQGRGFDEGTARAEANRLGELTAEGAFLKTRLQADVREVLTPEQRAQLDELRSQRQQRMQQRMQNRRGA